VHCQSYQPKLHYTAAQSKTTFSLSAQPVRVKILQQVFTFYPRDASAGISRRRVSV